MVNFTQYPWIVGFPRAESRELLSVIHDQYRKPEHQFASAGSPVPSPSGTIGRPSTTRCQLRNFPRLLERILIADEPQYADL